MRKNRKDSLINAAIVLFSQKGIAGTSMREISSRAGVTEGAIYRHFASKEQLSWFAFKQVIAEMIREKEHLVSSEQPFQKRLQEWVRLSYAYFDRAPEAFTYVLLMPEEVVQLEPGVTTRQGELFRAMFREARASGLVREIPAILALSHHSGVMLNVPRLINEGQLPPPASAYAEEVSCAIWRALEQPQADER